MTDTGRNADPDGPPPPDTDPHSAPDARSKDGRSDIEQAVMARSDALARGEGGQEADGIGGEGGAGGVVENQEGLEQ